MKRRYKPNVQIAFGYVRKRVVIPKNGVSIHSCVEYRYMGVTVGKIF
jgi:hypothetical protein